MSWETKQPYDDLAPDGSEIFTGATGERGGIARCMLPPGRVSAAVAHRTVEELWYIIEGRGQVWRKLGAGEGFEEVVDVEPGTSLTIPPGTLFQFRNTGQHDLCFVLATMPPWPGHDEAYPVAGHWDATPDSGAVQLRGDH